MIGSKIRGRRFVLILIVWVPILVLAVRLFWTAAHLETGPYTLATHWRLKPITLDQERARPWKRRSEEDRIRVWMNAIETAIQSKSDDAELHMAAAHVLEELLPDLPVVQRRSRALAARATEMRPGDVNLWRLRASLLFVMVNDQDFARRRIVDELVTTDEIVIALDDLAPNDPENGLYDYMASTLLFYACVRHVEYNGGYVLEVVDAGGYEEFRARWIAAPSHRILAPGTVPIEAVERLYRLAQLPPMDQAAYAAAVDDYSRNVQMLSHLRHIKESQIESARLRNDLPLEMEVFWHSLAVADQVQRTQLPFRVPYVGGVEKSASQGLLRHQNNIVFLRYEESIQDLQRRLETIRAEGAAYGVAMNEASQLVDLDRATAGWDFVWIEMLSAETMVILWLGAVWLVGLMANFRREEKIRCGLGIIRHGLMWAAALSVTWIFFGLVPADETESSDWLAAWVPVLWIVFFVIVMPIRWFWESRLRGQFSLKLFLVSTIFLGTAIGVWALYLAPLGNALSPFHYVEIAHSDRGWFWSVPESFESVYQYSAHLGSRAAIGGWFIGATCWFFIRAHAKGSQECSWRKTCAAWLRSMGRCAGVVAWITLVVYLTFAPTSLRNTDAVFQGRRAFEQWDRTRAEVFQRILADEAQMARIRRDLGMVDGAAVDQESGQ